MFRNYLKVTFRNALKNKTYSLINITGLSLGLAASIMMLIYVHFESSYDNFHSKRDSIYRMVLMNEGYTGGGIAKIFTPMGAALAESIPEVIDMTRIAYFGGVVFQVGDKQISEGNGYCVDRSFFRMFDFRVLAGNGERAFDEPNTLVITQSMATKYFGNDDPLGRTILLSNSYYESVSFEVVAVVEDTPPNSHFDFSFLAPIENLTIVDPNDWDRMQGYTYLQLSDGAEVRSIEDQAYQIALQRAPSAQENYSEMSEEDRATAHPFVLQPLEKIYLQSDLFRELGPTGDMLYVYIISSLAVFVILIACVNFINLSTARAASRAKEVGVRKANGASKSELILQFLSESIFFGLLSLMVAIGLIELLLPYFNVEIGLQLDLHYRLFLPWMIGGVLVIGILAGIYPSFYLSSFDAASILKENLRFSGRSRLRQSLVIFQFALSIALILASLIIHQQVSYMKNKDLGYEKEQVITVATSSSALNQAYRSVKTELMKHPNVQHVSYSGNLPGGGDWGMPFEFEGVDEGNEPVFRVLEVDEGFIDTYGIVLVEGRNFSQEIATDVTGSYILNEEGVRQLGWDNPVGRRISSKALNFEGKVIGVVKDFHFRSLHEEINPVIIFMNPPWSSIFSIKLGAGNMAETIDFIRDRFADFDPAQPFNYTLFEQGIDRMYQAEERLQFIVSGFTILTLIIAGIGLFGLASYAVISRTKEFGIRKVLGASMGNLIGILSIDFVKLILIAFVIALPVAYFGMDNWLNNFAYKTEISVFLYLLTFVTVIVFSLITVIYQAVQAAIQNPVESLHYE